MVDLKNATWLAGANRRPQLRPPLRWWGGKYYIASKILSLFPKKYDRYVEPYPGAASVLLNKPPGEDYYNDRDERLTRLFRVLRDEGEELVRRLQLTPYSEAEFIRCCGASPDGIDEVELVRRDFVRWRMSRDGNGKTLATPAKRSRAGSPTTSRASSRPSTRNCPRSLTACAVWKSSAGLPWMSFGSSIVPRPCSTVTRRTHTSRVPRGRRMSTASR